MNSQFCSMFFDAMESGDEDLIAAVTERILSFNDTEFRAFLVLILGSIIQVISKEDAE